MLTKAEFFCHNHKSDGEQKHITALTKAVFCCNHESNQEQKQVTALTKAEVFRRLLQGPVVLGFLEWVEVWMSSVIVTRVFQALVLSSFLAVGTTPTATATPTATSTTAAVDHGGLHTTFRQGLQGLWNVVGTWQQATQ